MEALSCVLGLVAGILVVWYFYSIPVRIAKKRRHTKLDAIRACSLFGLFFLPLWVGAIIWSLTEDNRQIANAPIRGFPVEPKPVGDFCSCCQKAIPNNATPYLYQEKVVCGKCYQRITR
jgi:hypothetical protein